MEYERLPGPPEEDDLTGNRELEEEAQWLAQPEQAPVLDATPYPDATGSVVETGYPGEDSWIDATYTQSRTRMPEAAQSVGPAVHPHVAVGTVFRCAVEGCGCEITITRAPRMPAIARFVDCCGHALREVPPEEPGA
jgi:hypothetical protein